MKVPPRLSGTSYACREGMKTGALKADGSRNPFVPEGIGPLNRSQQSRFGVLDAVVITGFLLLAIGVLAAVLRLVLG